MKIIYIIPIIVTFFFFSTSFSKERNEFELISHDSNSLPGTYVVFKTAQEIYCNLFPQLDLYNNLKQEEAKRLFVNIIKCFANLADGTFITSYPFTKKIFRAGVVIAILLSVVFGSYLLFVFFDVGLHQRLPLAFGSISIEKIPFRAAEKYGEKIIFTSESPCSWEIPALKGKYPGTQDWSAKRMLLTSGYIAAMLQQLGVKRGDRVAILKRNHFDIHLFTMSVVRSGGVACPINGKFEALNVEPYIRNIGARILFSDRQTVFRILKEGGDFSSLEKIIITEKKSPANFEKFEMLFAQKFPAIQLLWIEESLKDIKAPATIIPRESDEPIYFVHSSGTTGFPKAVVLRNGKQSHAIRGWLCYVHISRNKDKGFMAVPNNHQAVILTFNAMLLLGFRAHWIQGNHRDDFDAANILKELSEGRYTGYFGFPITYTQLKEIDLKKYELSAMRFWGTTADASHEAIIKHFIGVGNAFKRIGLPIDGSIFLDAQGSSEVGTPSVLRYITRFTKKFERRIGRADSTPFGPEIRVRAKSGEIAKGYGEVGRLEVKGKTVFDCYWNNTLLTSSSFNDGWFFTGDVACINEDGNLVQLDREVDVIRTKNGDVYSLPIEEKIHKHPAVFDACVYGERQIDGSQLPAAAIALRPGFKTSEAALKELLNFLLSENEKLNRCEIISWDMFPIGVTGKTLKRIFRERSEKILEQSLQIEEGV